mmetsp:Transcript_15280/g.34930  ORF Transcript_15280/g.34930 Transcript_15280/m.34930 type:complete len:205 (-) Transcript_15280:441-1055(-)
MPTSRLSTRPDRSLSLQGPQPAIADVVAVSDLMVVLNPVLDKLADTSLNMSHLADKVSLHAMKLWNDAHAQLAKVPHCQDDTFLSLVAVLLCWVNLVGHLEHFVPQDESMSNFVAHFLDPVLLRLIVLYVCEKSFSNHAIFTVLFLAKQVDRLCEEQRLGQRHRHSTSNHFQIISGRGPTAIDLLRTGDRTHWGGIFPMRIMYI